MNSNHRVISFLKCDRRTTVASVRIASFISETLQIPIIDRDPVTIDPFDTLIIVNGPSAFLPWVEQLAELVEKCKRVIWVMNDYTIYPPTQVRTVFKARPEIVVETWSAVPKLPLKWEKLAVWVKIPLTATHYINWNRLTYEQLPLDTPTKTGLFYYGAFREGRRDFFEKYLDTDLYPVFVSCSLKAQEKFTDLNDQIQLLTPWTAPSDLQQFQATLYMHDEFSSEFYTSPANRFYECLGAGIAQLFESSTVGAMREAGYDISPYIVSSPELLSARLAEWNVIRQEQVKRWSADYRGQLREELIKVGHLSHLIGE